MGKKRIILILMGRYLPGYKDGGPLRSMKNLTDRLGDEYDFKIITADRDHGDIVPYAGIVYNEWNRVGKAKVWYVAPGGFSDSLISEKAAEADVIYVCGCFNDYARVALRLKKGGAIRGKVIVASMGLFAPGAFHIKFFKKKSYLTILKASGYLKNIEWSATSKREIEDIKREVGRKAVCHLAEDVPRLIEATQEPAVKTDELKLVFLSRISREKNLEGALNILKDVHGKVHFDIYGPVADKAYFEKCMETAKELPENIHVAYKGEVKTERVPDVFAKYQAFLFPTLGENYGHVIYEAMASGCIPIISDRTSWGKIREMEAGMVISLEAGELFSKAIDKLTEISPEECLECQKKAAAYAVQYSKGIDCKGYRQIFG